MEESANHFRTLSISPRCITVLLEADVIGTYSKCCQLRKHEVLQHHYVTFCSNCNSSVAFLTPSCYSYDAAEMLLLLQNCNGCCRTVTFAAEILRSLQNCYGCRRTVTTAEELIRLLQNCYSRCITVIIAAEL